MQAAGAHPRRIMAGLSLHQKELAANSLSYSQLCYVCTSAPVRLVILTSATTLQEEESDDYGPAIIPETAVADAIVKRTEEHLKKLGGVSVSPKPIVMKVE